MCKRCGIDREGVYRPSYIINKLWMNKCIQLLDNIIQVYAKNELLYTCLYASSIQLRR